MHDSQRRALVRALFWLVCILPTTGVLAWAYGLRTDAYHRSWARRLAAPLGMRVAFDAVRLPQPGLVLFENFRCYDPETDAVVAQCARLEAEATGDGLLLAATGAEVFAEQGARLFAAVERRLKRESPDTEVHISFEADALTWHTAGGTQSLADVEALIEPAEASRQLLLNFHPAGAGDPAMLDHPCSLRISRSTATSPPETVVELDSGTGALPCSMFGPLTDVAASLGPQALWNGRIKLKHTAQGWEGMLSGEATQVDFQRLVGDHSAHQMWGGGDLRIHWGELSGGRIARLRGSVEAGPGQIGRDFVLAGVQYLGLGDQRMPMSTEPALLFDRLEFDFSIDADGLALRPRNATKQDALLWYGATILWRAPAVPAQPAANLLRALAPEREALVPLTSSTASLMNVLPLPATSPRKPLNGATQATLPQPRLRLRGPVEEEPQRR